MRLGILISGRGSNMQAIVSACQQGSLPNATVAAVIANKPDAAGIQWANQQGLTTGVFANADYETRLMQEAAMVSLLRQQQVDTVCLAGYMRIVSSTFIETFFGRVINIHPSLLPRHGGAGMVGQAVHKAVLATNETETGCTVHWVTPTVDAGPIIVQRQIKVHLDDTPDVLAQRVLAEEHMAYPKALAMVASGAVKPPPYYNPAAGAL